MSSGRRIVILEPDRYPEAAEVMLGSVGTVIRRRKRTPQSLAVPPAPSAEASMLVGEERRATVAALRRLPPRRLPLRRHLRLRLRVRFHASWVPGAPPTTRCTSKISKTPALPPGSRVATPTH